VDFVGALNMSNGKWYTLSRLAMRELGSVIFGKLHMRFGWVVNDEIMPFRLILLGGNILMINVVALRTCDS